MLNLTPKSCLNLILLISLISIILAFFIEYILGHQPCNLCLIERIPYVLSIILIIWNNIFKTNEKIIILLLIITFTFSSIVSFYHFGIEQNFFKESPVCTLNNTSGIISKEEILKQLQEIYISCKDVTFRVFGLSLTSINMFLSLILTILLTKIFISYEKNK